MINTKVIHHYGEEFNTNAADIIVPFIKETFNPKSIIDIGCGIGTWLKVFEQNGVTNILGIDGQHVTSNEKLLIPKEKFIVKDLNEINFQEFNKKFDLALCLEVAEHLEEKYANNLIATLCNFSDIIIFSAAMPGQTGENHLNEQYPTYWSRKFLEHDFIFVDLIRPKFWNNHDIEWWYRQNSFVVLRRSVAKAYNFTHWDEKIYIIKDMVELYTEALKARNSNNVFSSKALIKIVLNRLLKKLQLKTAK